MMIKLSAGTAIGLAGAIGMFALAGCASSEGANEKAWSDATAACERMESTDQRQQCFAAAMQKYQAAHKVTNASSCPKSTC